MTPEEVMLYYRLLLVDMPERYEAALAQHLEQEEPLSELVLALSVCRDRQETLDVLDHHLHSCQPDLEAVEALLREEVTGRYERGEINEEQWLAIMRSACWQSELALYPALAVLDEIADMAGDGICSRETYRLCVQAVIRGERMPDYWKLDRELRREKAKTLPCSEDGKQPQRRIFPMLKKFIGDKAFYRNVLHILIPLVIQQGISSFVSLLDNVMVGGLGTEAISAVAIVNQILMVYNLAIFGGLSGASIFGAQFAGKKDYDGMRYTFRFKLYFGWVLTLLGIGIFLLFGDSFIQLFLQGESNGGDLTLALQEGKDYLSMMLWGLIPFMLVQTYAGTLRETGETFAPMVASIIAILTNLVLNYCLIFGHFGFPAMGVRGAALATVISRYVEMAYVLVHAHRSTERYPFVRGVYRSLHVPGELVKKIAITGSPLLLNEIAWSLGMTFINQCYSVRGLSALAALNITSTAWNLFCVLMFAMGNAVSIMVGQHLGKGDKQGARDTDTKLLFLTVVIHVVMGALLMLFAGVIPLLYNVEPEVRELARQLLVVAGASLPIHAFLHATYFTIRSGGKTVITFLFDSVYTWLVPAVLAFVLSRYTDWDIVWVYFCIQFIDVVKLVIGLIMLRSDFWANNVVDSVSSK